jgi:hypothetical protein
MSECLNCPLASASGYTRGLKRRYASWSINGGFFQLTTKTSS